MPRDGSHIYHLPPGTQGIPDTTIESTKYNAFTADVEQDLNTPRPIEHGGTGANNAHDAMIALGGELASQQVTNYDTFPFVSGSFYSAGNATNPPIAAPIFGTAIVYTLNVEVLLIAYQMSGTGHPNPGGYMREMNSGVWGAWVAVASPNTLDAAKVNRSGDTMTGNLTLAKSAPIINLNSTDGTAAIVGLHNGLARFQINPTGGGAADDFSIGRFNDAGGFAGTPITITRASGVVSLGDTVVNGTTTFNGTVTSSITATGNITSNSGIAANGGITAGNAGVGGTYYFGNTASKYLTYDGTNFSFLGGQLYINNHLWAYNLNASGYVMTGSGGDAGRYHLGNTGARYLDWNGATFTLAGGPLTCNSDVIIAGNSTVQGGQLFVGPGGTGASQAHLKLNSGSANAAGSYIELQRNSSSQWVFGHHSAIFGDNSTDFVLYNSTAGLALQVQQNDNTFTIKGPMICQSMVTNQNMLVGQTPGAGALFFGVSGPYLQYNAAPGINLVGGSFSVLSSSIYSLGDITTASNGFKPGGGAWADSSDARIKNVVGDYAGGLDEILALRPKVFTFKGNDTHDAPSNSTHTPEGQEEDTSTPVVPYKNSAHYSAAASGKEYIGLIAQDADPVMPELVSNHQGYIDGQQTEILDLDTTPLVYALINAVKTLAARVEELEAARK